MVLQTPTPRLASFAHASTLPTEKHESAKAPQTRDPQTRGFSRGCYNFFSPPSFRLTCEAQRVTKRRSVGGDTANLPDQERRALVPGGHPSRCAFQVEERSTLTNLDFQNSTATRRALPKLKSSFLTFLLFPSPLSLLSLSPHLQCLVAMTRGADPNVVRQR